MEHIPIPLFHLYIRDLIAFCCYTIVVLRITALLTITDIQWFILSTFARKDYLWRKNSATFALFC